jgi:F0F1-type ATP synthase membrane subunit b/b'
MTEHGAPPGIGSIVLPAINFLLFVGLIVWKLPGPVKEFFRQRTARLREALAVGRRALAGPRRRVSRSSATSASCRPPWRN